MKTRVAMSGLATGARIVGYLHRALIRQQCESKISSVWRFCQFQTGHSKIQKGPGGLKGPVPGEAISELSQTSMHRVCVHRNKKRRLMSALGHKQTSRPAWTLSALPPKADIERHNWRFVPKDG